MIDGHDGRKFQACSLMVKDEDVERRRNKGNKCRRDGDIYLCVFFFSLVLFEERRKSKRTTVIQRQTKPPMFLSMGLNERGNTHTSFFLPLFSDRNRCDDEEEGSERVIAVPFFFFFAEHTLFVCIYMSGLRS